MLQVLSLATTLKYEFYNVPWVFNGAVTDRPVGQQAINLPNLHLYKESEHEILQELWRQYCFPPALRSRSSPPHRLKRIFAKTIDGCRGISDMKEMSNYALWPGLSCSPASG